MASHDFISILKNKHSFNLTVFGFSISTSFVVGFRQRIRMVISSITLSTDWSFPLIVKRPLFIISNTLVKLTIRPLLSLSVKRPRFVITMKQLIKPILTFDIRKPVITAIMRLVEKVPSWPLVIKSVSFVFTPIVARFHALWEYDNQTLASLDATTLTDMDYSVVP